MHNTKVTRSAYSLAEASVVLQEKKMCLITLTILKVTEQTVVDYDLK